MTLDSKRHPHISLPIGALRTAYAYCLKTYHYSIHIPYWYNGVLQLKVVLKQFMCYPKVNTTLWRLLSLGELREIELRVTVS